MALNERRRVDNMLGLDIASTAMTQLAGPDPGLEFDSQAAVHKTANGFSRRRVGANHRGPVSESGGGRVVVFWERDVLTMGELGSFGGIQIPRNKRIGTAFFFCRRARRADL